jgi:hypothetical protein
VESIRRDVKKIVSSLQVEVCSSSAAGAYSSSGNFMKLFVCAFASLFIVFSTHAAAPAKVAVCHVPPGNPANAHVLRLPQAAVKAHLAHGDKLGACGTDATNRGSAPVVQQNGETPAPAPAKSSATGKLKVHKAEKQKASANEKNKERREKKDDR